MSYSIRIRMTDSLIKDEIKQDKKRKFALWI